MKEKKQIHRIPVRMPSARDIGVTVCIMAAATGISLLYFQASGSAINVALFYMVAILAIPRFTEGYLPGIAASLVSVLCINYMFTYPFMELNFFLSGYPVTFVCMLAVSASMSAVSAHLKQQAKILSEREKELAEAEKEKMRANLLRAVSHDLRTPLTGIIGASSLYLENEAMLSAQKKTELVEHIREDADWLLNMVENLLTVTRIQNGTASVNKSLEPVEEVMEEAFSRLKKRMPEADIRMSAPEEFCMIPMDAILIEQVLLNLMENAVFHAGSERPVECRARLEEKQVVFSVRDYGVGIAPERLETIFDGVAQTENSASDSHKGMGIGLSICKTIILAHGGSISVRNYGEETARQAEGLPEEERLGGAEFSFTLPREEEPEPKEKRTGECGEGYE